MLAEPPQSGAQRGLLETARRLVGSDQPAAVWIGKEAVKELASPAVQRKLRA